MGLHSHVQLVIEIYGQNQRSLLPPEKKAIKAEDLTLPEDPTHPSYFPFSEPKFLEIAGLAGNPFCPRGARRQHPLMWTADFTTQATLYAVRYLLLGDNKTQRAQRWDPTTLGPGGQQWKQINDHLSQSSGFLKRLSDALNRAGHGMDAILKDSPLPSVKSLQEMLNNELIFSVLFDTERHREPMFRQPVLDFVRDLVPRLVKLWKRVYDDDRTVIMKLDGQIQKLWPKLQSKSLATVNLTDLRKFVKIAAKMKVHIGDRDWKVDHQIVDEYFSFCEDTAVVIGLHHDSERAAALPKPFIDMLLSLQPHDLNEITADLDQVVNSDGVALPGPEERDEFELYDCTSDIANIEEPELSGLIGTRDMVIEYCASWISRNPALNSYATGETLRSFLRLVQQAVADQEGHGLQRFVLMRHQMVAVLAMLRQVFEHTPAMNADDVGLGKTIQTLALCAVIAYMSDYFDKHQEFPGTLFKGQHYRHQQPGCTGINGSCPVREHDCSIPGIHRHCTGNPVTCTKKAEHGNFPDLPFIITAPPTLTDQWISQAKMVLQNGKMSILPFTSSNAKIRAFVNREHLHNPKSKFRDYGNTSMIIVVSTTAAEAEFVSETGWSAATVKGQSAHAKYPIKRDSSGLFGLRALVVFHDEAHNARKIKSIKYHALRAMVVHIATYGLAIVLTATPLVTGVEDVATLGAMIGAENFTEAHWAETVQPTMREVKKLASAASAARKKQSEDVGKQLAAVRANGSVVVPRTETLATAQLASKLRELLPHVIRRTLKDVVGDNPMPPMMIKSLHLTAYPQEQRMIDKLIEDLTHSLGGKFDGVVLSKNFYIKGRQSSVHYQLSAKLEPDLKIKSFPSDLTEWERFKTAKLDAVVQLIKRHFANRQLPPQKVAYDAEKNPIWSDDEWSVPLREGELARNPAMPQKAAVYSFFHPVLDVMMRTLELQSIKVFRLEGKTQLSKRESVLNAWRSYEGSAVLLISQIGAAGLNLQEADILIIVDPTWSASDDAQLAGRIYRKGQTSRTLLYKLILLGSADLLLHAIADPKKFLLDAFLRSTRDLLDAMHLERLSSRAGTPVVMREMYEALKRARRGDFGPATPRPRIDLNMVAVNRASIEARLNRVVENGKKAAGTLPPELGVFELERAPSSDSARRKFEFLHGSLDSGLLIGDLLVLESGGVESGLEFAPYMPQAFPTSDHGRTPPDEVPTLAQFEAQLERLVLVDTRHEEPPLEPMQVDSDSEMPDNAPILSAKPSIGPIPLLSPSSLNPKAAPNAIIPQKRRRAQPDEDDDLGVELAPKDHKQTSTRAQESDSDDEPFIKNSTFSSLLLQSKDAAGSSRDAPKRRRTANLVARRTPAHEANESMELALPPGRAKAIPPPRPRRPR